MCTPKYIGPDCSVLTCGENGYTPEYPNIKCNCKEGWDGHFCNECKDDQACINKYQPISPNNTIWRCDKSMVDYTFQKTYQCNLTDGGILSMIPGVLIDAAVYCDNSTDGRCHLGAFSSYAPRYMPIGFRRQIFYCYFKNCKQETEMINGRMYVRRKCTFTHCDCTGHLPCPWPCKLIYFNIVMLMLFAMKNEAAFECINGTNLCTLQQKQMPFIIKMNCTTGECVSEERRIPPPIVLPFEKDFRNLYIVAGVGGGVLISFISFIIVFYIYSKYKDYQIYKDLLE